MPPQSFKVHVEKDYLKFNAAHFMAYLIMARMGRLVTSLPMSLITLYQSQIRCEGLVSFAFSQSGQSPCSASAPHKAQVRSASASPKAWAAQSRSA